jgi:hypothetical protein
MGTNAVPFLVREAFTFADDSRDNLHQLFLELPEWASRRLHAEILQQAAWLLRGLRLRRRLLGPPESTTNSTRDRRCSCWERSAGLVPSPTLNRHQLHHLGLNIAWQSIRQMGVERPMRCQP